MLQGMNFIAGCLLLFMAEEDAFWCLAVIVEELLPGYFSLAMVAPQVRPQQGGGAAPPWPLLLPVCSILGPSAVTAAGRPNPVSRRPPSAHATCRHLCQWGQSDACLAQPPVAAPASKSCDCLSRWVTRRASPQ